MPQVTRLSKFHSSWRLSSRIRRFHFFMYFLVYCVNPFVSLTPVLRWPVPTAPLGGQWATCFTLVLLVYMDTWLRSSQSSTHSSSELFFLLQNRDFDLRPETVTSQKMVGTQVRSHTDAGLVAPLHHVHTDKVTKPGLQGKRVKTLLEKQNEAPAKGERKESEDAFLSSYQALLCPAAGLNKTLLHKDSFIGGKAKHTQIHNCIHIPVTALPVCCIHASRVISIFPLVVSSALVTCSIR